MNESKLRSALITAVGSDVVPWSEVGRRLATAGSPVPESVIHRHIQWDTSFVELADGIAYLPAVVDGVAFAAPVAQADADAGYIATHPWFDVFSWWLVGADDEGVELFDSDGVSLGWIDTDGLMIDGVDTDVIVGPEGWLDDHVGRWMALRSADGSLVVESLADRPAPPSPSDLVHESIRSAFDRIAEHQSFRSADGEDWTIARASVDDVITEAIAADRQTFVDKILVIDDEFLEPAGLRIDRHVLVPVTVDADVLQAATQQRMMMARFGVTPSEADDVSIVIDALERFTADDPAAFGHDADERRKAPVRFAALLEKPAVALAVSTDCIWHNGHEFARNFAVALIEMIGDDDEAASSVPWSLQWLHGHGALGLGQVDRAAGLLLPLSPVDDHLPLLVDRARIEIMRSRFGDARRLLLKAQRLIDPERIDMAAYYHRGPIEEMLAELATWADNPPRATARRNDPCPCGSGRKYKVCHQGRELHPIEERSAWLWHKMMNYARDYDPYTAGELTQIFDDEMGFDDDRTIEDSPLIPDLLLREEEIDEVFLTEAQLTLPDDEVLLGQQWQLATRSVFEVEASRRGTLELKDLATGDRLTVVNIDGVPSRAGALLIGRPLPVGDVYRAFSGFMALPPHLVEDALDLLVDGSAEDLVEFLGAVHAPPRLANTDGDALEFVDLTWSIPEESPPSDAEIDAGFVDAGFRSDDDCWVLLRQTSQMENVVVATVRRDGSLLVGSVTSRKRADELTELVGSAVPGLELVDRVVRAFDDINLDDVRDPEEIAAEQTALMGNPEIRRLLEAKIAEYEAEWLDTEIPALGGWTPRDAAADPIKREALSRLLATFPDPPDDQPGMSATRLRSELGL